MQLVTDSNAMMESFFSSLEAEVLDRNCFRTREEARREIFCWLAGWYNVAEGIRVLAIYRRGSLKGVPHGFGVVLLPHPRQTDLR